MYSGYPCFQRLVWESWDCVVTLSYKAKCLNWIGRVLRLTGFLISLNNITVIQVFKTDIQYMESFSWTSAGAAVDEMQLVSDLLSYYDTLQRHNSPIKLCSLGLYFLHDCHLMYSSVSVHAIKSIKTICGQTQYTGKFLMAASQLDCKSDKCSLYLHIQFHWVFFCFAPNHNFHSFKALHRGRSRS